MNDITWIEDFYSDLENSIAGYKRPEDYLTRAMQLVTKQYKPVKVNDNNGSVEHE